MNVVMIHYVYQCILIMKRNNKRICKPEITNADLLGIVLRCSYVGIGQISILSMSKNRIGAPLQELQVAYNVMRRGIHLYQLTLLLGYVIWKCLRGFHANCFNITNYFWRNSGSRIIIIDDKACNNWILEKPTGAFFRTVRWPLCTEPVQCTRAAVEPKWIWN